MHSFLEPKDNAPTRDKIMQSALYLFVEKGFFNTSIPDLVKHSGVSNGSIYHQFKDKQQLAEQLMDELIIYIEKEQSVIFANHHQSWDRYYQLSKWLLDAAESNPHMMQFILKAQHQEFLPKRPPICSSQPFLNLRDVIQKAMKKGDIKQMDVMVAASIAFGGTLRLIQLGLDGLLDKSLPSYLDEITQTGWAAIKK